MGSPLLAGASGENVGLLILGRPENYALVVVRFVLHRHPKEWYVSKKGRGEATRKPPRPLHRVADLPGRRVGLGPCLVLLCPHPGLPGEADAGLGSAGSGGCTCFAPTVLRLVGPLDLSWKRQGHKGEELGLCAGWTNASVRYALGRESFLV